jgi:aconitate hydratase
VRLRNQLAPGKEGPWTTYLPTGEVTTIFDASVKYKATKTPLVILAGKEYGSGSSRDWAAKGPFLLGVRVAIAESYERIHRSNLVGMGILPLQFKAGETKETLGLTGQETFEVAGLSDALKPRQDVEVVATAPDGKKTTFATTARIDTPVEVEYYKNGGILQTVLRRLLKSK